MPKNKKAKVQKSALKCIHGCGRLKLNARCCTECGAAHPTFAAELAQEQADRAFRAKTAGLTAIPHVVKSAPDHTTLSDGTVNPVLWDEWRRESNPAQREFLWSQMFAKKVS